MGYKRQRTVKIAFGEGHEFEGLEVRVKVVGIRKLLQLMRVVDKLDLSEISEVSTDEEAAEFEVAFQQIASVFDSWNIEDENDDGTVTPVPCTFEALMEQDLRLIVCVMKAWAEHLAGVPAPLGEPSNSGGPSLEASIPMDVRSESLAS